MGDSDTDTPATPPATVPDAVAAALAIVAEYEAKAMAQTYLYLGDIRDIRDRITALLDA